MPKHLQEAMHWSAPAEQWIQEAVGVAIVFESIPSDEIKRQSAGTLPPQVSPKSDKLRPQKRGEGIAFQITHFRETIVGSHLPYTSKSLGKLSLCTPFSA